MKKMKMLIGDCYMYGASVRGRKHIKENMPNQDAFSLYRDDDLIVMTVADGLGSKPKSDAGAEKVCKVVPECVKAWKRSGNTSVKSLVSMIADRWQDGMDHINDYAATCLLSILDKEGITLVQVGDGMVYGIIDNQEVLLEEKTDEDFTNITSSIASADLDDWKIKQYRITEKSCFAIVLSTDGVSEDLLSAKRKDFTEYLVAQLDSNEDKSAMLNSMLEDWGGKYSLDDKTLAILYRHG